MDNEALCEEAKKAIDKVFEDRSVDVETAILNLEDIREHVDMLINSLGER